MQHKVGFTTGINKDIAKDKYANSSYYHANNVNVITNGGLSTGSIENEKGNALLFSFPAVGARYTIEAGVNTLTIDDNTINFTSTLSNEATYNTILLNSAIATLVANNDIYLFYNDTGVYVQAMDPTIPISGTSVTSYSPATTDIHICGWERLNEWLIVFTSDSEDVEPSNALCQIWKFKFTSGSRVQIDGASGTTLVGPEHLIYNDYLNFSTETYIRDIVSNYETSTKGRVYWTDYYNQLRVANVFDEALMSTKPNDLGLIAEVTLSKPIITSVENVTNGLPAGAHYQYFYKLLDSDGRESIFSPGSQLVDVQEELSNDSNTSFYELDSTSSNTINNKLFNISISDIDTDYNVIELYVVIWESLDSPSIYKVTDGSVTGSEMQFVHSSLDGNINIPVTEFMEIGIPFTAKTIDDRDKILTAGNIKQSKFDLDFDARAYRFKADSTFDLLNSSGDAEYTSQTSANYTDIAETADAVNPTNDDTNTTYNYDSGAGKQVYQADGVTLGGSGINIEYGFTANASLGSEGSKALKDDEAEDEGYNKSNIRVGGTLYDSGLNKLDGSPLYVDLTNELNNVKSNMVAASFTGYARGEVYRFAIVFYSKSGQRSYAKWIGDIKMPDPSLDSTYKVSDSPNSTNACENVQDHQSQTAINTFNYNIGVTFNVDVSSIQNDISGFEIVRVNRTVSDRSRLGTGVVTNFVDYGTGDGTSGPPNSNNINTLLRKYADNTASYYPSSVYNKTGWTNTTPIDALIKVGTTSYGDSGDGTGVKKSTLMLADHPSLLSGVVGAGTTSDNDSASLLTVNKTLLNFTAPCSDFREYTEFNVNTNTDFIRDYGYYDCKEYVYNDDYANGEVTTSNVNAVPTGFLYRAKKYSAAGSYQNYRMTTERYLQDGEIIYNDGSVSEDTTLLGTIDPLGTTDELELVCNTSYTFYSGSDNSTPLGLGTAKQFIRLDTTSTGHITTGASLDVPTVNPDAAWSNQLHYFKEVGYCREIINQYGGDSYESRSKNLYITTGAYQIIDNDSASSQAITVFGGDTYVVSYDREYIRQYHNGITTIPFNTNPAAKMSVGFIFSAETPVNTVWRTGDHFGGQSADIINNYFRGSISTLSKGDLSLTESFTLNARHQQTNNVRTDYLAKDFLSQNETVFPNRIKVSRTKLDGEFTDSWRSFPANQFDDVDGSLGQIHKLITFKNQLIYFQDRGVGILPINERAVIEDVTGAELVLGDGQLIGKYNYLTETSGSRHQHSIVVTDKGVYYYDSSQQKIYMLQGGALTETLGLSSYFHNEIKEILRDSDDLYKASPTGVHGVYDKRNERVLFTFLNGTEIITKAKEIAPNITSQYYSVGDIVTISGNYYECLKQNTYLTTEIISSNNFKELSDYQPGITIGYRERLQAFESFYDFKPGKFLNFDDKLLSIGTDRDTGYIHEEGDYGTFYDNVFDSDITLVVMPNPNMISIFNNIEYYSEITLNKEDIVGETLDTLLCWNEHQNTGQIPLTVGTLAKRRIRTWRHQLKRDILNDTKNSISKPRLRNYYILMKLSFTNNNNKRLVLSDIVISYTPNKM